MRKEGGREGGKEGGREGGREGGVRTVQPFAAVEDFLDVLFHDGADVC